MSTHMDNPAAREIKELLNEVGATVKRSKNYNVYTLPGNPPKQFRMTITPGGPSHRVSELGNLKRKLGLSNQGKTADERAAAKGGSAREYVNGKTSIHPAPTINNTIPEPVPAPDPIPAPPPPPPPPTPAPAAATAAAAAAFTPDPEEATNYNPVEHLDGDTLTARIEDAIRLAESHSHRFMELAQEAEARAKALKDLLPLAALPYGQALLSSLLPPLPERVVVREVIVQAPPPPPPDNRIPVTRDVVYLYCKTLTGEFSTTELIDHFIGDTPVSTEERTLTRNKITHALDVLAERGFVRKVMGGRGRYTPAVWAMGPAPASASAPSSAPPDGDGAEVADGE